MLHVSNLRITVAGNKRNCFNRSGYAAESLQESFLIINLIAVTPAMLTPESNPSKLADDNWLAFITVALGKRKFPLVVRTAVTGW
ncbi:hypothetical protein D3C80_1434180 [compost metagenome]